jgi:hypothetical protein
MVGQQGPIWFLTGANFGGVTPPPLSAHARCRRATLFSFR